MKEENILDKTNFKDKVVNKPKGKTTKGKLPHRVGRVNYKRRGK